MQQIFLMKFLSPFLKLVPSIRITMSTLNRNSSADFPVDMKHVLHVWQVLHGSRFSSRTFGLQNLKGRREAVAILMNRSYDRIRILTTNWTLEGPSEVPESTETVAAPLEDSILNPVVGIHPGRKPLITPDDYDAIREVIHTLYKSKAYVTLKTLLEPVHEKLNKKIAKSTLYEFFVAWVSSTST